MAFISLSNINLTRRYVVPNKAPGRKVSCKKHNKGRGWKRPFEYNKYRATAICNLITQGYSLSKIEKMKGMPTYTTIARWLKNFPEFYEMFCKAKTLQTAKNIDDIIDIADESDENSKAGVLRAKLRVDTRKWAAEKLLPRIYGPKVGVQVEESVDSKKQIMKLEGIIKSVEKRLAENTVTIEAKVVEED